MSIYKRISLLIALLAVVSTLITVIAISALYNTSFAEKEIDLSLMAKHQAALIDSVARFDRKFSHHDHPGGPVAATLSQILDAQIKGNDEDSSVDLLVAQQKVGYVNFLMRMNGPLPPPINIGTHSSGPMTLAIAGKSGTVISTDFRGVDVLAAYEPIRELNLGIVTKIDLAEIREPFIRIAIAVIVLSIIIIVIGAAIIVRVTRPIIEEIVSAKDLAEKADRSKTDFLANMSHELRTPLNAIIGFSELIKTNVLNGQKQKYMEYAGDIHSSGIHLLNVINDILDMAKIEANSINLYEEEVDVVDILERCYSMQSLRAEANDLTLKLDHPTHVPHLFADALRVKQILTNLLSNAIKFSHSGGIITSKVEVLEDNSIAISICDTGVGIAKKDIPTALAKFGQIESSYSRNHEGTGLGLSLVQLLMETHHGSFVLSSELGEGTIATIIFPSGRSIH